MYYLLIVLIIAFWWYQRMPLTAEQEATLEETSHLSALSFVDTPLYESLIEGNREVRLSKLQKFFKNRHWIMMHKGIEFILVRDEKKKLQAFCFLVTMDK